MTLRKLMQVNWLLVVAFVGGCDESPSDVPESTAEAGTADQLAIFQAAWNHDTDKSGEWRTLVIHDEERTRGYAKVSLFSLSGEQWEYDMRLRHGRWEVGSAELNRPSISERRLLGGTVAHSPSSTDPVLVGRVRMQDSFGTDYLEAQFAPIEGTVTTLLDAGINAIDRLEWMHDGTGFDQITYDERNWEIQFDRWHPCYLRFPVDGSYGYHCEWIYQSDWLVNFFGTNPDGSSIEASHTFLTYHVRGGEELDTEVAYVSVSPDPLYLSFGEGAAVNAFAYNAANQQLSGKAAEWTVEHGEYATVDSMGAMSAWITAVGVGTTVVYASVDGEIGSGVITVDPTVSASGPSYAYQGFINVDASPAPAGGSYHYEWDITYCRADPDYPPYNCTQTTESSNGTSGQDATTQSFVMQPDYRWVDFQVTLRYEAGGRVVATDVWRVDGAGEYPECTKGICPEGGGVTIDSIG